MLDWGRHLEGKQQQKITQFLPDVDVVVVVCAADPVTVLRLALDADTMVITIFLRTAGD